MSNPDPGWMGERLWHPTADDWEPAVAGRRDSNRVYMLTTRFGGKKACPTCPDPAIRLKVSHDGGLHWGKDRYLCRCPGGPPQYDHQIELDSGRERPRRLAGRLRATRTSETPFSGSLGRMVTRVRLTGEGPSAR